MKKIIFLIILILSGSCNEFAYEKSKSKFVRTWLMDKELYKEIYEVANEGAWGREVFAVYMTDSINFRTFLGTYDFGIDYLDFEIMGDTLNIYRFTKDGLDSTLVKVYSRNSLIKERVFE